MPKQEKPRRDKPTRHQRRQRIIVWAAVIVLIALIGGTVIVPLYSLSQ